MENKNNHWINWTRTNNEEFSTIATPTFKRETFFERVFSSGKWIKVVSYFYRNPTARNISVQGKTFGSDQIFRKTFIPFSPSPINTHHEIYFWGNESFGWWKLDGYIGCIKYFFCKTSKTLIQPCNLKRTYFILCLRSCSRCNFRTFRMTIFVYFPLHKRRA